MRGCSFNASNVLLALDAASCKSINMPASKGSVTAVSDALLPYRRPRRRPAHLRTKTGCLTCESIIAWTTLNIATGFQACTLMRSNIIAGNTMLIFVKVVSERKNATKHSGPASTARGKGWNASGSPTGDVVFLAIHVVAGLQKRHRGSPT